MVERWRPLAAPDVPDLILFDGDCVLCSRAAHFVHANDPGQRFRFVAIQSELGRALAKRFSINSYDPETNIVILDGVAHFKSDAGLRILALAPRWRWLRATGALPPPVRNWLYDVVARNRYRVFGRREACWAGDAALRARIVSTQDELFGLR